MELVQRQMRVVYVAYAADVELILGSSSGSVGHTDNRIQVARQQAVFSLTINWKQIWVGTGSAGQHGCAVIGADLRTTEAAAAGTEVVHGLIVAVVDAAGRPNTDLRIVGEAGSGHRELPNMVGTVRVVGVGDSDANGVGRNKDVLRQEPAIGLRSNCARMSPSLLLAHAVPGMPLRQSVLPRIAGPQV